MVCGPFLSSRLCCPADFPLLQVFTEEVRDACEEMRPCVAACDIVVAVVVGKHHERFSGLYKSFGILHGVAEVHVVVGCSVADQEFAAQMFSL